MFRSILTTLLVGLAAVGAAAQGPSEPAPTPPSTTAWREALAAAVRRATAQNPRVREAEARAEAARHRVAQSSALPDPEVELGLKDAPVSHPSLTRDDFTMEMVTGRQHLPGRGKRAAGRAIAEADVESAAAAREREAVEIAADTADAFFQLAAIDRGLALLADARRRLEDAAASATELYKVGKTGLADVLQANLETTSLDEQLSSLRAERRAQAARFNTLQGLPAAEAVPPIPPIPPISPIGPVAPDLVAPAAADLARRAAERSPAVMAAQAEVHRAEQELELAGLESRPDWTLLGYYGHRERFEDLAGVSASINLPWAHRGRLAERRAEKEAALAAARAGVEAARDQLEGEIAMADADLQKNLEQARLYRDSILPQADLTYRAAREAYAVGKIDFQTLARAADNLTFYQREAAARASGIGRALAALQRASGLPLIAGTPGEGGSDAEK
jgi:cobalt-zinc-cadmium efflux system outer membrane protein